MLKGIFTLTIALACIMMFADGVQPNGSGTYSDPYLMESLDNLLWLSTTEDVWGDNLHFLQTQDIDASDTENWSDGAGFSPIGWYNSPTDCLPFIGTYDGGNFEIRNLFIYRPDLDYVGLWGSTRYSHIENLSVVDASVLGADYVGALAGALYNAGTVENSHSSGTVTGNDQVGGISGVASSIVNCSFVGTVTGNYQVGGITGQTSSSSIASCTFTGTVAGNITVGGISGYASSNSISDCSFAGTIAQNTGAGNYFGGLVGYLYATNINNCHADIQMTVNDTPPSYVGGLVGYLCNSYSEVTTCYATGSVEGNLLCGALFGHISFDFDSSISNVYYDYDAFTINGEHRYCVGALPSYMFGTWVDNGYSLDPDNYLTLQDGYYSITNPQDLLYLLAFGQNDDLMFHLTEDIDLAEYPGFTLPLFQGTFNGAGHKISNIDIDSPDDAVTGFIAYANKAELTRLHLDPVNIQGHDYVGGLIGMGFQTEISHCSVHGEIIGQDRCIGGICGGLGEASNIKYCCITGEVSGPNEVGGIIGGGFCVGVQCCSSAATIESSGYSSGGIGGGLVWCDISDCYFTGCLNGTSESGGIAGQLEESYVRDCFVSGSISPSTASSIVGKCYHGFFLYPSVRNSVWNTQTTGVGIAVGYCDYENYEENVIGCTTAEMLQQSTYLDLGWDFVGETENGTNDYWDIFTDWNQGYPYIHDIWVYVENDEEPTAPPVTETTLHNAYPNPFNPTTTIRYSLAETGPVEIAVYNIRGQKVKALVDENKSAGNYDIVWDGTDLSGKPVSSGVYFYRMSSPDRTLVKKMTMVK